MSNQNKNGKTPIERLAELTQQAGLLLMTAAFTWSMAELPDQHSPKIVVPNQPALAVAPSGGEIHSDNSMRREREEAGPHYTSYGASQRTPGRTGRA